MPPKKGKGKGKKEKKSAAAPEYVPDKQLSENDKKFYMMRIELLEKQSDRYQKRRDELSAEQRTESEQVKAMEQDFEILKYAKKQVELKEEEIADLKDRLVGLGQAKELEKEMLQKQLLDLKTEIHDLRERYESDNNELRNQVSDLEHFRAKQDSYLERRQQQQETLKFREEDHVRKLESIKKKDQYDRDRLKKDMVQRMNQVAADFRRASNKQMAETTKRTINENARIEQTVNDMEDVSARVQTENEHIVDANEQVQSTVRVLQNKEERHAFQHATSAEIIQLLANMLRSQEETIVKQQARVFEMDSAERRMKELRASLFEHQNSSTEIQQENKLFTSRLTSLDMVLTESVRTKTIVLANLRRAVALVTESLKIKDDDKKALVPVQQPQLAADANTGNLFKQLLEILTSENEENIDEQIEPSLVDTSQSTLNLKHAGKRRDNLAYSLGDMGFVPRRDAVLLTNFDKMRQQVYPARERDTIRRAAKKSVAVQTPGLAQGSFGSDVSLDHLSPYDQSANMATREQFDRPSFGPRPRVPYAVAATKRIVQYVF